MGEGSSFGKIDGAGMSLYVSFPSLFALASSKEAWVANLWVQSSEGGGWNPSFSRPFNDGEFGTVGCFLLRI